MDKLFVYIAGDARGEPGEAGIGFAVTDTAGRILDEVSALIGRATPSGARYRALTEAAQHVLQYEPASVIFFTDDQKLSNYINGVFETRAPNVKRMIEVAIGTLNRLPHWRVNYVDRSVNVRAPRLVERAFHQSIKAQVSRERLELVLQARASNLSEDALQRLVDFAERLQEDEEA